DALIDSLGFGEPQPRNGKRPDHDFTFGFDVFSLGQNFNPWTRAGVCSPSALTSTFTPIAALAVLSMANAIGAAPSIGLSVLDVTVPICGPIDPSAPRSNTWPSATGRRSFSMR